MDAILVAPPKAKRSNLHFAVAHEIGSEIVSGALPVGKTIPAEPELCERFNVSRTVVREAVKLLASKGLLQTGSGKGTWVPPLNEWNFLDPMVFALSQTTDNAEGTIRHLFAFRRAIEPAVVAEAALTATRSQLDAIEYGWEIMAAAKTDFSRWIEGDVEFHSAIYVASNNVFMAPLANLLRQYFKLSFRVSSSNFHHQHCLQEHRDLLDAIRNRQPDGARRAVQILLDRADEDVRTVLTR